VDAMTIIPAGSVVGDPTRSIKIASSDDQNSSPQFSPPSDQKDLETKKKIIDSHDEIPLKPKEKETVMDELEVTEAKEVKERSDLQEDLNLSTPQENDPWETNPNNSNNDKQNPVVGQVYIKNLLFTLFPEKNLNHE
jgi:carbon dioxide concentrating mechanism protein CcmN